MKLARCNELVQSVTSTTDSCSTIRAIDDVSDTVRESCGRTMSRWLHLLFCCRHSVVPLLFEVRTQVCQAYDAAEFCRNVHESAAWRAAALRACILVGGAGGQQGVCSCS